MSIDKHVNEQQFENRVYTKSGYVIWEKDCPVGVMVHCILWENQPFLNFIFVKEKYRGKGYVDCGGLLYNDTPFEQPMELFMRKIL